MGLVLAYYTNPSISIGNDNDYLGSNLVNNIGVDMDGEDDSVKVIIVTSPKLTSKGVQYGLYCERKSRTEAEAIKTDLIEQGCLSTLTRRNSCWAVWWAK